MARRLLHDFRPTGLVAAPSPPPLPLPALFLALLSVTSCAPTPGTARGPGLAVVGATVFDGTGSPPLMGAFVVVEGDRIKAVGPQSHVPLPKGVPVLDARGKFVVPYLETARVAEGAQRTLAEDGTAADTLAGIWKRGGAQALSAGAPADFLILDADPRIDLANLSRVHRTIRGGRVLAGAPASPGS